MELEEYVQGEPFELIIADYLDYVNPINYGITGFIGIDPQDYFVTSGDAVSKTKVLEEELQELIRAAKKRFGKTPKKREANFISALTKSIANCKRMLKILLHVRGDSIFLELEWRDHKLYALPKNPRAKGNFGADD